MTPQEVLSMVKENNVKMVDLRFMDYPGLWQHFSVPVSELDESNFEEGYGFDGSSIRGWQPIHASDMLVVPDPDTAKIDPFFQESTLVMICNIVDPITHERYSRDPRNIAQKAEAYLKSTGIGDTAFFGPEAEFFIFDNIRYESGRNRSFYEIDSVEGIWKGISPFRPWTNSRICAPRWSWRCRTWASISNASTTKWPPPARPKSTCASNPCCRWPIS
jgi:glutamine synthetase